MEKLEWGLGSYLSLANARLPCTRAMTSLKPSCDVPVSAYVVESNSSFQLRVAPALRPNTTSGAKLHYYA